MGPYQTTRLLDKHPLPSIQLTNNSIKTQSHLAGLSAKAALAASSSFFLFWYFFLSAALHFSLKTGSFL